MKNGSAYKYEDDSMRFTALKEMSESVNHDTYSNLNTNTSVYITITDSA